MSSKSLQLPQIADFGNQVVFLTSCIQARGGLELAFVEHDVNKRQRLIFPRQADVVVVGFGVGVTLVKPDELEARVGRKTALYRQ